MTRKIDLPEEDRVREVLAALRDRGCRPTAAALARELGLSNTTFWRHFRDVALELQAPPLHSATAVPAPRAHEARLRRERDELTTQLRTAIAHVRRLTIENSELRRQLEDANNITHISTFTRARDGAAAR